MKTLLLVRHAKAKPATRDQDDLTRVLDDRGVAAASALGQRIQQAGWQVDRVLISPARRTQMTADRLLVALARSTVQVQTRDDLYLASAQYLLKTVQQIEDSINTLMIVGHNPGLESLAQAFLPELRHLGTADLVRVSFRADRWRETSPSCVSAVLHWVT